MRGPGPELGVVLLALAALACGKRELPPPPSSTPRISLSPTAPSTAPPAPAPPPPTRDDRATIAAAANRRGLDGLKAALNDVESIALMRWDRPAVPEPMAPKDRAKLLRLMRRGGISPFRTVAYPPWAASLLIHTHKHGSYAVTLVGTSTLALDPGTGMRSEGRPPELALPDEDLWLMDYFESHLGDPTNKEYRLDDVPEEPRELGAAGGRP